MSLTRLRWLDGFRFLGTDSWGNETALDADRESGTGAKPSDLLPISLAACTAYEIVNILRKQRQDVRGLEAEIRSEQEPDPPWAYTSISVAYSVRGPVDPVKARKALALGEAKYCSISATLRDAVALSFSIRVADGGT